LQASGHGTGNFTIDGLYGALIASPNIKGPGVTINYGAGLRIQDMRGYGNVEQGSIIVNPQTGGGGTGTKGNFVMKGGDFDSGHINLGSGPLWYDDAH